MSDLPFGGRLVEKDLSGRRERLRILPYASGTNYGTSGLCRSFDSENREKVRSKEVERQASEASPPLCNSPSVRVGRDHEVAIYNFRFKAEICWHRLQLDA